MKPRFAEMPEAPDELVAWLERKLVGPDVSALVGELAILTGSPPEAEAALMDFLKDRRSAVLEKGLAALDAIEVRALVARPGLLLQLERLVADEGGPHWNGVARTLPEAQQLPGRSRRRLEAARHDLGPAKLPVVESVGEPRGLAQLLRHPLFASLATAALLLLAIALYGWIRGDSTGRRDGSDKVDQGGPTQGNPTSSGPTDVVPHRTWGWTDRTALDRIDKEARRARESDPNARADRIYLEGLAQAVEQWSRQEHGSPAELAARLAEFRLGCSLLLQRPHAALSSQQEERLAAVVRACAERLDRHMSQLDALSDRSNVSPLREQADETARSVAAEIRRLGSN